MNCNMDACYTEYVDGTMLSASNADVVSIANSLVVTSFNISPPNPGESFTQPTRIMSFDSAGKGTLDVTFVGGDLRYTTPGNLNMLPPLASGSNCKIRILGATSNTWDTSSGATVVNI